MKLKKDYLIVAWLLVALYLLFLRPKTSFKCNFKVTSTRCANDNNCLLNQKCMNNGVSGKFCWQCT